MSVEFKQAFISYLRLDPAVVVDIVTKLVAKGCTLWFDEWDMIPGSDWEAEMETAINASGCCVVFVGSASKPSPTHTPREPHHG
jgi:hypothetical protein